MKSEAWNRKSHRQVRGMSALFLKEPPRSTKALARTGSDGVTTSVTFPSMSKVQPVGTFLADRVGDVFGVLLKPSIKFAVLFSGRKFRCSPPGSGEGVFPFRLGGEADDVSVGQKSAFGDLERQDPAVVEHVVYGQLFDWRV